MTPTLRPYQQAAVAEIRQAYQQGHRSVLFVLPTGGGKTVVFSHIAEQAAAKGSRICILVHRQELLRQASNSLQLLGVRHGLISPRHAMDLSAHVQVASVQTLARRLLKIPSGFFNLLVVDEAHHSNAGTWAKVLEHFQSARVLGVTATPCRSDGRGLGEWYSHMVLGPTAAELTAAGFLAPARVLAPPGPSLVGLRKRMGDYDMSQAGQILQAGQAMGDCLAHYRRHLDGQTAIAFCCSVAHAEAVARLFSGHGIAAASIDGTMDSVWRQNLLSRLASGDLKVLTSCALIGEGVDVPSVAGCILLRPTQSVSLHLQMIGRCLRPQPGKTAVVLDHVGNYQRLGHHLEDREWTLDGRIVRAKDAAPSVKICPSCFAAMNSAAGKCPECGHAFVAERREPEHVEGELVEISRLKIGDLVELKVDTSPYPYDLSKPASIAWFDGFKILQIGEIETYNGNTYRAATLLAIKNVQFNDESPIAREGDQLHGIAVAELRPSRVVARREQAQASTLEELVAVGRRRGMKNPAGWARHVMAARSLRAGRARVREVVG